MLWWFKMLELWILLFFSIPKMLLLIVKFTMMPLCSYFFQQEEGRVEVK